MPMDHEAMWDEIVSLREALSAEKATRERAERKLEMLAHGWSVIGAPADFTEEGIICAFRHHVDVIDRLVAKTQQVERERDEAQAQAAALRAALDTARGAQ